MLFPSVIITRHGNISVECTHYANMSMYYADILKAVNMIIFKMKSVDIFLIFAQNIDRGYMLKPPPKTLPDFIMSSILLSKTDIGLKLFFANNVRYGNLMNFKIGGGLRSLAISRQP